MKSLTGTITQIPPMYSAIKVNGRKLYEYARAGETVKRPTRLISVTKFELISTSFDEKKAIANEFGLQLSVARERISEHW